MAPQGQAQRAVVGHDVLAFLGRAQQRQAFRDLRFRQQRQGLLDPGDAPGGTVPVPCQHGQGAGGRQRRQVVAVESSPGSQRLHRLEGRAGPRFEQPPRSLPGQAVHPRQAEPDGGSFLALLQGRLPVARAGIHRPDLDAVLPGIPHQLRRGVEAHWLAVEQRTAEGRRLVALEPGGNVDQQGEAGGVRLREAVFPETQDLLEHLAGEALVVAALAHALHQALLERPQRPLAPPRGHRPSQPVRLAGREPRRDDRELHHLLLEDGYAEGAFQYAAHPGARVHDRLEAGAAAQERVHHLALDRARPDDGHLDHQVVEVTRPEARQHRHLRARLHLEHADGVRAADHVVDRRVLRRNVLDPEGRPAPRRNQRQRAPDGRQHAEAEDVHLEQAEFVEVVLVPLDDGPLGHGGVLDRHQLLQRPARDHEAPGVLRQVAGKAHQLPHQPQQPLHQRRRRVEAGVAHPGFVDFPAVPPLHGTRQPVHLQRVEAERLADIADRAARPVGDHRGGQRRAMPAVLRIQVLDHLLAPLVLEIHVDVGGLVALARDEALEQQRHPRGIHLGDAERIADR